MPDAPVLGGGGSRPLALDERVFGARFHESLVHESVRAEQAARRRGTASTRTRGMVSGGGSKPWRQKGTGRARAGSIRSPLWTGGGVVFGPQPRSYTFKVNRRERRAALRGALSLHASRGSLAVLESEALKEPRTKGALELLSGWGQDRPTLVVLDSAESAARLSFRNLAGVRVLAHDEVGVSDLLAPASLLISRPAVEALTARATDREAASQAKAAASAEAAAPSAKRSSKAPAKAKAKASEVPAEDAPQEPAAEGEPAAPEAEADATATEATAESTAATETVAEPADNGDGEQADSDGSAE